MANNDGCLKCDRKWRNRFQCFLNQICGPPRRNPMILNSDINKITKAVCTCVTNLVWQNIGRDKINEAHVAYRQSSIFQNSDESDTSVHKYFYDRLVKGKLFENPDRITSADRLVYILHCCNIPRQPGVPQNDIMQMICPRRERPNVPVVHLGSLKKSHIGRLFGSNGTGIREAVHGIPVGNIKITFGESNGDTVTAYATFNCKRRHIELVERELRTRLGYYQTDEPIPLHERGNRGRGRRTIEAHPGGHGDSNTGHSLPSSGYETLLYSREQDMETNLSVATDTNASADMDTDIEDQQG